jgi:hypothetical protein
MPKETIRVWYDRNEYKYEGTVQYFPTYYDKAHTKPAGAQIANGTTYVKEDGLNYYNDFSFYYFHTTDSPNPNPSPVVDSLVIPTAELFNDKEPIKRTYPVEFTSRILWGNGKYQNATGTATFTFRKDGTRQTVFDIEY